MAAELLTANKATLWFTSFAELEFINALGLRTFRKQILAAEASASQSAFEHDASIGVFQLRSLPETLFVRARRLSIETTPEMGTRTSDLLHIAAALELGADVLYTFDRQQRRLAKEMKLKINPMA
jgi:predicted nucleic acid-binding protein